MCTSANVNVFFILWQGGAAFWYNIKSDGKLDDRTLHGACPVLVGYKWGKYKNVEQQTLLK